MLNENQIGRDGAKPLFCAITGRQLIAGDVYIGVGDANVGVKASEWIKYTPDQKAALRAEWAQAITPDAQRRRKASEPAAELGVTGE